MIWFLIGIFIGVGITTIIFILSVTIKDQKTLDKWFKEKPPAEDCDTCVNGQCYKRNGTHDCKYIKGKR